MTNLLINVFGGLAIFIFGMKLMSDGLHHVAGDRMRSILRLFSSNRFIAICSGAAVTTVIQSSSASTVMVIGFVNAGLLTLIQAIGIIFGANIGTTITAQLVAFDIAWIIMPSIILGLLLSFIPYKSLANWSETIIGLGFLFLGMELMSDELKQLSTHPAFMQAFQLFRCAPVNGIIPPAPLFGAIGIGLVATLIIQSSSACSGIIIALGAGGLIDLYTAVALVLGSNIGTTVTAQLAAITANRVAKQAALAHTLFNVIGAVIITLTFWITIKGEPIFFQVVNWISADGDLPRKIANAHTVFNVFTTLLLTPFIPLLAKICEKVIPVQTTKVKYSRLEPHLLDTPSIALAQTTSALHKMLKKAWKMNDCALRMYNRNDEKNQALVKQLDKREEDIDERQRDITGYLASLMQKELSREQAEQIPLLLHCTNDVEKIGDHAEIIREIMNKLQEANLHFSPEAEQEYAMLHQTLASIAKCTASLMEKNDPDTRSEASLLRQFLTEKLAESEKEHITRINAGACRPQVGILYLELLEEIRKVAHGLFNIMDREGMFYGKLPKAVHKNKKIENAVTE
ncbi:MAG: Na/Pi cotransporter family protein [Lentisphaeria bacterium]|nr:Na/Pi cotransporter family protein [Lentisphaeria bacterium]